MESAGCSVAKDAIGIFESLVESLLGDMIQFDEHIFQMGWFNHQLV